MRPRILGFVFFTHLQGRMVSYMWMSWRVCLIVRESGIGWNHWKSVLCQIVKGFLIGCHWQSIIPLTVRESLIGYEFLFLFMLPMNKVISGTRRITMCLWCHQNLYGRLFIYSNFMKTQSYTILCVLFIFCCFAWASSRLVRLYLGFWIDLRIVLVFVFYTCISIL